MNEKEVFDEEPNETPMHDDADFALLDEAVRPSRAGLIASDVKSSLNDVLKDYREDPSNALVRGSLVFALEAVVTLAVRGLVSRAPWMWTYHEDIKQDVWEKLLQQEAKQGQFFDSYDFNFQGENGKSQVYGWVWRIVRNAKEDLRLRLQKGKKEGYQEVSLSEFEADDKYAMEEGKQLTTPKNLHVRYLQQNQTETSLRDENSFIRIGELTHWLEQLADEMVEQTREWQDDTGKLKRVVFTHNHSLIWRQWLGFSDPKLIGLNEKELSDELGFSLPKLKRYSSEAFEYMRQHPGYLELLVLMVPKRKPAIGHDIKAAIEARGGRGNFRKMIQAWLVWHVEFSKKLAETDGQQVVSRVG